jgi:hypothetical protein
MGFIKVKKYYGSNKWDLNNSKALLLLSHYDSATTHMVQAMPAQEWQQY